MNTQTLSLLLENRPGVLARVVNTLSGQGWNILSLAAAPSENAEVTRATIVAENDADPATQLRMVNKLEKLIPTISAIDITSKPVLSQEMVLVRLRTALTRQSAELQQIVKYFGAQVAEKSPAGLEFQAAGCPVRIDEFVAELSRYGDVSFARSGLVALGSD